MNSSLQLEPGSPAAVLADRIDRSVATVAVIGMGYVGFPLARALHMAGYRIIGFDIDERKIDMMQRGESYLGHFGEDFFRSLTEGERFAPTSDPDRIADADVVVLCVPTPLGPHREPDLSYVIDSTRLVSERLRPGQLIVLESTTYPGTTRDRMVPILDESGLTCGKDYFVAFSPEREDPGRAGVDTAQIPKLVGGIDPPSTDLAVAFYSNAIEQIHKVSSAEVAEAAKILENVYRAVNIALVNELKVVFDRLGIDVWEVVEAASTKPFGFQPFYPGPGLGGHCIPIDPFYLAWRAKEAGYPTRFIELAGEINSGMPRVVVDRVAESLNDEGIALNGAKVLVSGIAYKPDIDDIRETPAAPIIEMLQDQGAAVSYHDPHCPTFPEMKKHDLDMASVDLNAEILQTVDCVLIVTDHAAVDYALIGEHARLVVDTRNAMAGVADPKARIIKA
ncbi:MAG: nucleotide sugar dehydrogenase [Planctomycetota bacterium]|nr:nucleotide sugar dehydrogenase [Planctomycetota bacterium]